MSSLVRTVRRLRPRTIWQRPTVAVWNAASELRVEPDWLAFHLPRLGFECVCVKVVDGPHPFAGSAGRNLSTSFLDPLRKAGLRLTGWGYLYGVEPELEARTALEVCREHGLRAFTADCEVEFEYDPRDSPSLGSGGDRYGRSRRFVAAWQAQPSRLPLALTSFGRVDLHRLDWAAFSTRHVRFGPQCYLNESELLDPVACVRAAEVYWRRGLVHPWIGVYGGALGRTPAATYVERLRLSRTRGFTVYLADTAQLDELRPLAAAR